MAVVVKISGSSDLEMGAVIEDIAGLWESGRELIVVHGGSGRLDEVLELMGEEPEYVETPGGVKSRFTDEETMKVFNMVMAGELNVDYTSRLQDLDVNAVGLSGVDGALLTGPRKSAVKVMENGRKKIRRGEHSGKVEEVNTDLLRTLMDREYLPVISLPMLADDGTPVNADGDRAAAAIAGEMEADLVIITDVPGVFEDPEDMDTLIEDIETPEDMERAREAAEGFMTKKVMASGEALEEGAESVTISDADTEKPVTEALGGRGTGFTPGAV